MAYLVSGGFQGHAIKIRIFLGDGCCSIASARVTSLLIVQSRAALHPLRLGWFFFCETVPLIGRPLIADIMAAADVR